MTVTTTELTSKRIKLQRAIGLVVFAVGLAMAIIFIDDDDPSIFWPSVAAIGLVIMLVAAIRKWWHHS